MSGLTEATKIEMMEMFKRIMKKMDDNLQLMKENNRSLKEDLCKKWDDCQKDLRESISRSVDAIKEDNRLFIGKSRKEREQSMEQSSPCLLYTSRCV